MLTDYARLILFATGLLVGVQVPGFVNQYAQRVSAHQIEITTNFRGFQQTADQFFGGNVEALIVHHETSPDRVFQDEARTIRGMFERLQALTAELAAMQGSLVSQIIHVAFHPNREILGEARREYSYTVPLNERAIACGLVGGVLLAMLGELALGVCFGLFQRRPRALISR